MRAADKNETIRLLFERKSVRAFEDRDISPGDRELILRAAMQAPTAGNQQMYTIIDVKDPKKKARLAESCDHQPFIAQAKMVLVFCADMFKWHEAFRLFGCDPRPLGAGDLTLAAWDAVCAAQNAVTAAWSLGIGSCYIGDILENRETQKEILSLPDQVVPAAMAVFGYPTEQQLARRKPDRAPLEQIVHENGYRVMDATELQAMLAHSMGEEGFEDRLRRFCQRKYQSDFSREMSRSMLAYWQEFLDSPWGREPSACGEDETDAGAPAL